MKRLFLTLNKFGEVSGTIELQSAKFIVNPDQNVVEISSIPEEIVQKIKEDPQFFIRDGEKIREMTDVEKDNKRKRLQSEQPKIVKQNKWDDIERRLANLEQKQGKK